MAIEPESFSKLDRICEPSARLDALRILVTAEYLDCVHSPNPNDRAKVFPLVEIIRRTSADIRLLRDKLVTAEHSGISRSSVDYLFRHLNAVLFLRFGTISETNGSRGRTVLRVGDLNPEDGCIMLAYAELLGRMQSWRSDFYRYTMLKDSLGFLTSTEQKEFAEKCGTIAQLLQFTIDPAPSGRNIELELRETLDQVQELRTIAQAIAGSSHSRKQPDAVASQFGYFLVEILPPSQHEFGLIGLFPDEIIFWWDSRWTKCLDGIDEITRQIDFDPDQLENALVAARLFDLTGPERTAQFEHLRSGRDSARFVNLTSAQIPLDLVIGKSNACHECGVPQRSDGGLISYWGEFKFRREPKIFVDDSTRKVFFCGDTVLEYPNLPAKELRLRDHPIPLPFASYERWMLEDFSDRTGWKLETHTGESATRRNFLSHDWSKVRILHITTHGFANGADFELSNFMVSESYDQPERIHFLDILSRDWSQIELVFLNTCLTQAGDKPLGESAISLAWAFLAAGAKQVIACRWQVKDSIGWQFARRLYSQFGTIGIEVEPPRQSEFCGFAFASFVSLRNASTDDD